MKNGKWKQISRNNLPIRRNKSSKNDEILIKLKLKLIEFKQETNDNDFYLDLFEDIVLKWKQQENMIIQN